jgi:transglutaminase-like putative cysteine protease
MKKYLASSYYINWQHQQVKKQASNLASSCTYEEDIVKQCFEWVRDSIHHSADYQLNPVTCRASDVLQHKTGYCYAKSHLLAALLRANAIPTGLCYQRLSIDDKGAPYSLHGLNAVFLKNWGWYRLDARGNKTGIDAQFNPPEEQLAFPIRLKAEADLAEIWSEPLKIVTSVLEKSETYQEVYNNLPDIELIT